MNALPDPPRPTQHDPIAIALAEDIGENSLGVNLADARLGQSEDSSDFRET